MKSKFVPTLVKTIFLTGFVLLLTFTTLLAQEVQYSFANIQSTNAGPYGSVEFDVMINSSEDFALGSGQVYLNYNAEAFGENAITTGKAIITVPPDQGYLLSQKNSQISQVPAYTTPVLNNNTTSRISVAFRQLTRGAVVHTNVTEVPRKLFHVRFDYGGPNVTASPDICFENSAPFDKQTFIACGSAGADDCQTSSGILLPNDLFDCTFAYSPVPTTELAKSFAINLFPVPAQDFVQVKFNSPDERLIDVNLWDDRGRLITTQAQSLFKGENNWNYDTSSLAPGVYFFEFSSSQSVTTKKLVIVR